MLILTVWLVEGIFLVANRDIVLLTASEAPVSPDWTEDLSVTISSLLLCIM